MDATQTKLIDYFSGFKQNLIPLFQRPYSWSKPQWNTLWDDIISFYDHEDAEMTHFMGAVVTMPAKSVPVGVAKFLVIDGQQRLTTIAILLCALRDSLGESHVVSKRRIQNHYLTNDGYEDIDRFKLLPTDGDRANYAALIDGKISTAPPSPLIEAYKFFLKRLAGVDGTGGPIDLNKFLDIIEKRLMGVMINLSDSDDPYLIFESLNFKGAPLEQSDLVRNYFLMRFTVGEQKKVYDDLWLPMQKRLGPLLTDFMRHFLGSEGEEVRKSDVYAGIKRLVSGLDAASLRILINRMANLSILYSRIAEPENETNVAIRYIFQRFKQLDFTTAYPFLLALYEDYEDEQFTSTEFTATIAILDSYIIRRSVVGVPSNSLSSVFISLAKLKPETEEPTTWLSDALCVESKNRRWPTDSEFKASWMTTQIYTARRACNVILRTLEQNFEHKEAVALADLTVEHIMPQTLTSDWKMMIGPSAIEHHEQYLHTIGNLTLTGYNSELSNFSYDAKIQIFADSHLELNKWFAVVPIWNVSAIQTRSEALFNEAVKIWPRPETLQTEEPTSNTTTSANFHFSCIAKLEKHLSLALSKVSRTRYQATTDNLRVVCAVSTLHQSSADVSYYWFSLHQPQINFLEEASKGLFCLGCGSVNKTLAIPVDFIKAYLPQMGLTSAPDHQYWHVRIHRSDEKLVLRLLGSVDGPALDSFLV